MTLPPAPLAVGALLVLLALEIGALVVVLRRQGVTRQPLCFGDDERGQAAMDPRPTWSIAAVLGVATIVGAQVIERMQAAVPRPVGETTLCGGGCGVWIGIRAKPMLVVLALMTAFVSISLYWASARRSAGD